MTTTDEIRRSLSNSTAVHFAAGTVDLAAEKLRELPATFDKLRAQAPERFQTFRENELPRLREQAQTLAQQGAETAREYAVKARETYDELAERGKSTVEEWNTKQDGGVDEDEATVVVQRLTKTEGTTDEQPPTPPAS